MQPPTPSPELVAMAGLREVVGEAVGTLRQVAGLDRARGGARLDEQDDAVDGLFGHSTTCMPTRRRVGRGPSPSAPATVLFEEEFGLRTGPLRRSST